MPCKRKGICAFLDVSGTHANCCWASRGEITRKHSTLQRANRTLAAESDTGYRHEVPAFDALDGNISKQLANAMFPKAPSAADMRRSLRLHELAALIAIPDTLPERKAALTAQLMSLVAEVPANGNGLRLDAIVHDDQPANLWIDFHVQHPWAASHLKTNDAWFKGEHTAERLARSSQDGLNSFAAVSSPSVVSAEATKRKHYALLTAIGQALSASGRLTKRVEFLPVVVSHVGEFGAGAFTLAERYARNAQRSPAFSPYVTGISSRETGSRMRKRAKDSLMCSTAKGWGRVLSTAGASYC